MTPAAPRSQAAAIPPETLLRSTLAGVNLTMTVIGEGCPTPSGRHIRARRAARSGAYRAAAALTLDIAPGDEPFAAALAIAFSAPSQLPAGTAPASRDLLTLAPMIRRHEDRVIRAALAETPGRRAAADRLGISERTLR